MGAVRKHARFSGSPQGAPVMLPWYGKSPQCDLGLPSIRKAKAPMAAIHHDKAL